MENRRREEKETDRTPFPPPSSLFSRPFPVLFFSPFEEKGNEMRRGKIPDHPHSVAALLFFSLRAYCKCFVEKVRGGHFFFLEEENLSIPPPKKRKDVFSLFERNGTHGLLSLLPLLFIRIYKAVCGSSLFLPHGRRRRVCDLCSEEEEAVDSLPFLLSCVR